jgi:methionyl-tRNA formyltransferase
MAKRIVFYGGCQVGMITLLTILALKHLVVCVIPVDELVESIARKLNLKILKIKDINSSQVVKDIKALNPDLIICCNGKQIFGKELLGIPGINLHANLYKYPGNNPIEKMIKDKEKRASVGVHWITEIIDGGPVIIENFKKIKGTTEKEIYNELYSLYSLTLTEALNKI